MKEYICKQDLIDYLIKEGEIKEEYGFQIVPYQSINSSHGSCCVCQTCGQYHDDCVCSHNTWVTDINAMNTMLFGMDLANYKIEDKSHEIVINDGMDD